MRLIRELFLRAWTLYWMNMKAFARKLGYDWARELTVLVCGAVVFATFIYVFHDFLNHEVKLISQKMFETLGRWGALATMICSSAYLALILKKERRHCEGSISQFADAQGERRSVIRQYQILRNATLLMAGIALVWWLVLLFLVEHFFWSGLIWQLVSLILFYILPTDQLERRISRTFQIQAATTQVALIRWRLLQILRRNRRAQWALLASFALMLMQLLLSRHQAPLFLHILLGFFSGWLASTAINTQLAADLKFAWMEKLAGVSHEQFMSAYRAVSFFFAIVAGIITLVLIQSTAQFSFSDHTKVALAAAIPLYMTPALAMQIDARRAFIQMVTGFLVSLFLVTAVFAHYLAVILVPIVEVYAMQQQHNRFYRSA